MPSQGPTHSPRYGLALFSTFHFPKTKGANPGSHLLPSRCKRLRRGRTPESPGISTSASDARGCMHNATIVQYVVCQRLTGPLYRGTMPPLGPINGSAAGMAEGSSL